MGALVGRDIVLGVTGGIAAYKSCELVRLLTAGGAKVVAVMTDAATKFVGPETFRALTGRPVHIKMFDAPDGAITHIELTAKAGLFIIAPATANIIGKAANGIADDLLSTMLLAAKCPVLFAPAMNCRMWDSAAVRRNIRTLASDGAHFVGPEEGEMACGEFGPGRMSEPAAISDAAEALLGKTGQLAGKRVLVSAGPTFEDIDPVRFIGNRSTGRMGFAVAREAKARGADVTLVAGPTELAPPAGVTTVRVRSAEQMKAAVLEGADGADVVIMAAAVSDYRPADVSMAKIKKGPESIAIKLVRTDDILKLLGARKKKGQVLVGFAAETDDLEKNARGKLKDKMLDLIAANPVGGETGFGSEDNVLRIYGPKGLVRDTGRVSKDAAAGELLDCIAAFLKI